MAECVPIVTQLLGSKVATDVLESLEFLSVAFEFSLCGADAGLRRALVLVWSPEAQVREAIVNTYLKLYMNPKVEQGVWLCVGWGCGLLCVRRSGSAVTVVCVSSCRPRPPLTLLWALLPSHATSSPCWMGRAWASSLRWRR